MSDFFNAQAAAAYDDKNLPLAPIAENMHFLIRLILQDLPTQSRILCVGVGTGAEILSLAEAYPQFSFVGVDPSAAMLEVCEKRLIEAGVMDRCVLVPGYVTDISPEETFDAVLTILVGHFVKREEKPEFYQHIYARLKNDGYYITTEISFDLESVLFPLMLKEWEKVQSRMGATAESLASLPHVLKDVLSVLSPEENEELLRQSGLRPMQFFQSFMIIGWLAKK